MSKYIIPVEKIRKYEEKKKNINIPDTNISLNPNNIFFFNYINYFNNSVNNLLNQQNYFNELQRKGIEYLKNPNNVNHYLIANLNSNDYINGGYELNNL